MRLAIYVRLSKEDEESNSIDNQIREGKEFASRQGFDYHVYNEGKGVSGTWSIDDRPALKQLTDDIRDNKIDAVWVRNQNRLERSVGTFDIFSRIVKSKKIDLYFGNFVQR